MRAAFVVGSCEALKGAWQEPGRKPGAAVADVKLDPMVELPRSQRHAPAAVAQSIVKQIAECLLQPQPVGVQSQAGRRFDLYPATVGVGAQAKARLDARQHLGDVDALESQREIGRAACRER